MPLTGTGQITQQGTQIAPGVYIRETKDTATDNPVERRVERVVVASYPEYISFLPARGTPIDGIPAWPNVTYRGCTITENQKIGNFARYRLEYRQTEPDTGELPPDPVLRERATAHYKHLKEHPDFATDFADIFDVIEDRVFPDAGAVPAALTGRRWWAQIEAEIAYTEYFSSDPGSIKDRVGTQEAPPGESDATKWRINAGTRGREGRWWARTLVYGYNPKGYDPTADVNP